MKKKVIAVLIILACTAAHSVEHEMQWEPVPYAGGYIVEVYTVDGERIIREKTGETSVTLSLPVGEYRYRVITLNRLGESEATTSWKRVAVVLLPEPVEENDEQELAETEDAAEQEDSGRIEEQDDIPEVDTRHTYTLRCMPAVFISSGVLGDLFHAGGGLELSAGVRDVIWENTEFGLYSGLMYVPGTDAYSIDYMLHIPAALYGGYSFQLSGAVSLFPFVRAGTSYSHVQFPESAVRDTVKIIDPLLSGGGMIGTKYKNCDIHAGGSASFLFEDGVTIPYYIVSVGIGYSFTR